LTLKRQRFSLATVSIDVKFFNNSGGDYFYNPFFDRLIPLPAQLAIYDNDKKYLGGSYRFEGGSQKEWLEQMIGLAFSLCYVGATLNANISNSAPGDYYVQVIFYKSLSRLHPLLRRVLQKIRPCGTLSLQFCKN